MAKKSVLDPKFDEAIQWMKDRTGPKVRAFSGAPYWIHPLQVATLVMKFKKSHKIDELVLGALFHDLVEDTTTTLDEIRERWGGLVASLVGELTSDPEGLKAWGKGPYLAKKVLELSDWGLVLKLCDRLANVSDFLFAPREFVERYGAETKLILHALAERKLTATQREVVKAIVDHLYMYRVM